MHSFGWLPHNIKCCHCFYGCIHKNLPVHSRDQHTLQEKPNSSLHCLGTMGTCPGIALGANLWFALTEPKVALWAQLLGHHIPGGSRKLLAGVITSVITLQEFESQKPHPHITSSTAICCKAALLASPSSHCCLPFHATARAWLTALENSISSSQEWKMFSPATRMLNKSCSSKRAAHTVQSTDHWILFQNSSNLVVIKMI